MRSFSPYQQFKPSRESPYRRWTNAQLEQAILPTRKTYGPNSRQYIALMAEIRNRGMNTYTSLNVRPRIS